MNGGNNRGRGRDYGKSRDREMISFAEATEDEEEVTLLMVCDPKEETQKNLWYIDTGCSSHMCGDRSTFSELDETFRTTVKLGDDSFVSVQGRGKVKIQTKLTFVQSISDVFYVPNLKTNLLSVGQLQGKGYEVIFKDGLCKIQDCNLGLIAKVTMTANKLFPLLIQHIEPNHSCFSAQEIGLARLWHYRYGHLSFGGLQTLQQKNMVAGLPAFDVPSEVCADCVIGKMPRDSFPKGKA
ncbi:hypothetical protein HRI_005281200 [Hibiscus trionum]|uniref:GAG-pre-integrase domain-containing protein n=1 Tax=Hibiscus trionum TaxID=183268 RepID=A0A9W7MX45_HIBTR|nr:hypothetical protein HRI_005281200 [Hibiscus trionum]